MATVTLRLDDQTRDELEQLARARNSTVSDVLRAAIDGLLGRDVDTPRAEVPRSLDMVQRRSLALLHEILARFESDDENQRTHARSIRILTEGYTAEYHREFASIEAELTPADCSLLMDVLDMFTVLEGAIGKLDDAAVTELGGDDVSVLLEFAGFDYQNPRESRLADFAEHLIGEGRWSSLAHHFGDVDGERTCPNSHMPMLGRYQRLLQAYEAIVSARASSGGLRGVDAYRLDVDDLKKILAAVRRHPDAGRR